MILWNNVTWCHVVKTVLQLSTYNAYFTHSKHTLSMTGMCFSWNIIQRK